MAARVLVALGAVLLPLACTSGTTGEGGAGDATAEGASGESGSSSGSTTGADAASVGDATMVGSLDALVPGEGDAAVETGEDAAVATDGDTADAAFVPLGIAVMPLPGGNGVLEMIALTLQKGPTGIELYAALKNDDPTGLACAPGLSLQLYDKSGQPIGTWIGGIDTFRFYDYEQGDAGELASCVGPGDVVMASLTGLPADLDVDDVGTIVYQCSYWALQGPEVVGLSVSGLTTVVLDSGTAFTGTLVNGFDAAAVGPSVDVFVVNAVGRPLGLATTPGDAGDIPAGGGWTFQTNAVDVPVVGYVAYPTATTLQ
jgi:hypothetical protein